MQKLIFKTLILFLITLGNQVVVAEQPMQGEPAPDFELRDQDGQPHSIED